MHTHHGRHRAADEIDRLEHELKAARLSITGLRMQLTNANAARDRANERANTLAEAAARAGQLETELNAVRAELANARWISVPPGVRDITPGDEPTHPIDVRPQWATDLTTWSA